MDIGLPRCECLDLMIFDLGDALVGRRLHLGDASPWRRFLLATLVLGVSSSRRRLVLTLTPGIDFDLDFVNARIRDGTRGFLIKEIRFSDGDRRAKVYRWSQPARRGLGQSRSGLRRRLTTIRLSWGKL